MDQPNAGRSREVGCDELLARHGDYLDGLLTPVEAARLQLHMEVCPACMRYDRVVRRGAELVRDLPEIAPSSDFELRLQHRLFHVDDGAALGDSRVGASAVATFAVAGVIALLAWSPVLLSTEDGVAVGPAPVRTAPAVQAAASVAAVPVVEAPEATRSMDAGALSLLPTLSGPLLRTVRDPWEPLDASLSPLSTGETVRVMAAFPGPYSPLVVSPPVHGRSVRTISTEYTPID